MPDYHFGSSNGTGDRNGLATTKYSSTMTMKEDENPFDASRLRVDLNSFDQWIVDQHVDDDTDCFRDGNNDRTTNKLIDNALEILDGNNGGNQVLGDNNGDDDDDDESFVSDSDDEREPEKPSYDGALERLLRSNPDEHTSSTSTKSNVGSDKQTATKKGKTPDVFVIKSRNSSGALQSFNLRSTKEQEVVDTQTLDVRPQNGRRQDRRSSTSMISSTYSSPVSPNVDNRTRQQEPEHHQHDADKNESDSPRKTKKEDTTSSVLVENANGTDKQQHNRPTLSRVQSRRRMNRRLSATGSRKDHLSTSDHSKRSSSNGRRRRLVDGGNRPTKHSESSTGLSLSSTPKSNLLNDLFSTAIKADDGTVNGPGVDTVPSTLSSPPPPPPPSELDEDFGTIRKDDGRGTPSMRRTPRKTANSPALGRGRRKQQASADTSTRSPSTGSRTRHSAAAASSNRRKDPLSTSEHSKRHTTRRPMKNWMENNADKRYNSNGDIIATNDDNDNKTTMTTTTPPPAKMSSIGKSVTMPDIAGTVRSNKAAMGHPMSRRRRRRHSMVSSSSSSTTSASTTNDHYNHDRTRTATGTVTTSTPVAATTTRRPTRRRQSLEHFIA